MAVWLVRAGGAGEQEELALREGAAVIGWDELPDQSAVQSREDVETLMRATYPGDTPKRLSNWAGQVWAFVGRIQEDDLIALPLKRQSAIAFGKVTGPYRYRKDLPDGAHHTRPVKWLVEDLPRSALDQDLLYSLGAFMTVCQIQRNNAEERIRALLEGRVPPTSEDDEEEEEEIVDLARHSLDQIRSYISQKFRGHGLARLVQGLLESQGYQTQLSGPGPDGGVDIIAGRGPMGFDAPRLIVQVKSADSPSDVRVLRELQGVMRNFGAERGLLVSWGGFKRGVYEEARKHFFEIRLWDADDLVEQLTDSYEALPDDLQAELPLRRIWTLVLEE